LAALDVMNGNVRLQLFIKEPTYDHRKTPPLPERRPNNRVQDAAEDQTERSRRTSPNVWGRLRIDQV
jgi:hypothetical protein